MSERTKAKLVRTIEINKSAIYVFSCVDCGKEFWRSANNRRINPYCGECQRRYDKIKNAENKAKRQAEHDKQIRADVIEDLQKLYLDWQKEIKDFYYADEETTRFLKRLKTHLNLEEVNNS